MKYSMHSIFFMLPYPDRIVVTCSNAMSDFAIFFSYSIFSRSAYVSMVSLRFSMLPVQVCDLVMGKSSKRVELPRSFVDFYWLRMNELTSFGFLERREALGSRRVTFLASCSSSSREAT